MIARGHHPKNRQEDVHDIALDLNQHAVTLFTRPRGGEWNAIGQADLASSAFAQEIDELRVEATVRGANTQAVLLWLPEDQVLVRQYLLHERGPAAEAEARRRIASETSYEADELAIALGPAERGEPTPVLAALKQTVVEAEDYARRWGFPSSRVSTRVGAELFRHATPLFRLPERPVRRAARISLRAVTTAAAAAVAGIVVYVAATTVEPLFDSVEPTESAGPIFATVRIMDQIPSAGETALSLVRIGHAQGLALRRFSVAHSGNSDLHAVTRYGPAPRGLEPAALLTPGFEPQMQVGAAAGLPETSLPGRLVPPPSLTATNVRVALAAIDRTREVGKSSIAPTDEKRPRVSRQTSQEPPAAVLAALPPQGDTQPSNAVLAAPTEDAIPSTEDELAPTEFAPVEVDARPKPKPAQALAASEDTGDLAEKIAPQEIPQDSDDAATKIVAAQAPASEVEAEEPSDAPTIFAALAAPKPLARPRNLVISQPVAARTATPARGYAPRSVRNAAAQSGLSLDQTSLIGIFDVRSGRHALVRLPTGSYQKVARGDVLDGWRVNSISREALRLSKQGQNRTLLLVSR